jgi:ribonuclease Z
MQQLYVFGTGNAQAVNCYNTCFAIRADEDYFMVDAGGGNGILRILREMNLSPLQIHHLFVSHAHTDHVLGVIWVIRLIAQAMKKQQYEGKLHVYCHKELKEQIFTLCEITFPTPKLCRLLGDRIVFHVVSDGESKKILGHRVTFFDLASTKKKQFGFQMRLREGGVLCFGGDEPLQKRNWHYAEHADWLLLEAFCCYADRERFQPYEKNHSTAKDACELAQRLQVKQLVLWHTEDSDLPHRKEKYGAERGEYCGGLAIPDDREILPLSGNAEVNSIR